MQPVCTPNLTRAPALALLAALACAALLVLTVPQAHRHAAGPHAPAWVALIGGMPLQQARCEQWLGASAAERQRGIAALHAVVGGPTPFGQATALTSAQAERLFDRTCSNFYARNFLLYELYTRAAGFRSLVDPRV